MQRKKAASGYKTSQKYQESHSSRASKIEQQWCAYHQKQKITNFCRCEECLLPVCPTCIKVHTDEHRAKKTNPKFQEINKVIEQIRDKYYKLDELVKQIKKLMVEIQTEKKYNQAKIREKLIYHRGILIGEFQKSLIEMQNRIINEIVNDDQSFIQSMESMDEQLCKLDKTVSRGRDNFQAEQILKHIILYYSKRSDQKYKKELQSIKDNCMALTEKKIIVTVNDEEIKNVMQAIAKYMTVEIKDFSFNQQRNK